MEEASVSFGFREVSAQEKAPLVRGVFDAVASRYDVMNDVMSAGIHRLWKKSMAERLPLRNNVHVLDLAGGTGDIAFRLQDAARTKHITGLHITVSDINEAMLKEGLARSQDRNLQGISWAAGNAESLPFPSHHFDGCTMAFGIRNVTHIENALAEIHRVLKPGATFLCLEFCPELSGWAKKLQPAYDAFSLKLLPWMGERIAQDAEAYRYLAESIRRFLPPDALAHLMRRAGFARVSYERFSAGIVALHRGVKP